ncbi:MAG: TraC family protein, partial [Aquificaceae bacterium]
MFLKKEELKNDLHRENFSRYLPWLAYDGEFYYNQDDTVGFILMSMPTYIAGGKIFDSLKGLLSYSYPNKTIIQFILTADDYIEPFLIEYERRKVRANPLVRKAIEKYKNFLRESAKAGKVRQFRFFVAVKCPMSVGREKMVEIKENFVDRFKGMGMPVELLPPEGLLGWLRYIFNRELNGTYDENVFIKDQVITKRIEQDFNKFMLGERYGKTFTVKAFPKEINDLTSNLMSGGIWGAQSDLEQIKGNFILSFNFIYEEDLKNKLLAKGNYILFQKGFLGFAQSLAQKQEEVNWMIKSMNEGEKFIRVIPSVVVFGENESNLKEVVSSVKRVFEGLGFYMQEEYGINLPIFLLSLPHGLYYEAVKDINRDFIFSISTATRLIPLQADFAGNGASLVLIGRKGQIGGIDIFDKNAINYNMVITASSGAGKSFFVNYIVFNVYAEGGIIRIIDIGGSYKKLVKMLGAKYIDIAQEQVCLNPFSFIKEEEDFKGVVSVVSSMANVEEESIEYRLIQDAVRLAYEQ